MLCLIIVMGTFLKHCIQFLLNFLLELYMNTKEEKLVCKICHQNQCLPHPWYPCFSYTTGNHVQLKQILFLVFIHKSHVFNFRLYQCLLSTWAQYMHAPFSLPHLPVYFSVIILTRSYLDIWRTSEHETQLSHVVYYDSFFLTAQFFCFPWS